MFERKKTEREVSTRTKTYALLLGYRATLAPGIAAYNDKILSDEILAATAGAGVKIPNCIKLKTGQPMTYFFRDNPSDAGFAYVGLRLFYEKPSAIPADPAMVDAILLPAINAGLATALSRIQVLAEKREFDELASTISRAARAHIHAEAKKLIGYEAKLTELRAALGEAKASVEDSVWSAYAAKYGEAAVLAAKEVKSSSSEEFFLFQE